MMTIECVGLAFTYRWPTGEVRLVPGQPIQLPEDRGARLLEKAPDRVRVVERGSQTDPHRIGSIVNWESPLFGLLHATVLEDLSRGVRVRHPLTAVECVIPVTWLRFYTGGN